MALPKIPHSSRPITTRMAGHSVDAGQTEAEGCSHNHFGDDMNMLSIRDNLNMLPTQYTKRLPAAWLQRSITLPNDVEEVPQLAAFVDEVCEAVGFDMSLTMSLNLAIEEAVVNVMEYAYPEGTKGDVHIEAAANDECLEFVISDSGAPFDPTAKEDADITLSAEERPIGGLGIHLVRQIMDSINYERTDGQNVLTLLKKLKTS